MRPFEKVFVINLPFKKDRLERLASLMPKSLGSYEIWSAVHGDTIRPPANWHSGNGAWGCYRSHMQILEHCMANHVDSYLVIEDDAIFSDDFCEVLEGTMKSLPDDWCQLYLGGQLLKEIKNPPKRINEFVYMPYNVNRTHCFALHSRGYQRVYDHLFHLPFHRGDHIDHRLGRLHETGKFPVYCSRRWVVGQNDGMSNISGKMTDKPQFWHHPENCAKDHWLLDSPVCVFLEASPDVAAELQVRGWHQGGWKNDDGLDRGVCDALAALNPEPKLAEWYQWVRREVMRDDMVIPCLWHPRLDWGLVSKMGFADWVRVQGTTADECVEIMAGSEKWKGEKYAFAK